MKKLLSRLVDYYTVKYYVINFYYNLKWFFKNLFHFMPIMWKYRTWSYSDALQLFIFGLKDISKSIENGHEIRYSADLKIKQINTLIELLNKYFELDPNVDYFPIIDQNRDTWFDDMRKTKEKLSKQIVEIIFGESEKTLKKKIDKMTEKVNSDEEFKQSLLKEADTNNIDDIIYIKINDGKGLESWWD